MAARAACLAFGAISFEGWDSTNANQEYASASPAWATAYPGQAEAFKGIAIQ